MKHTRKNVWISIAALILIICALTGGLVWYASVSGTRENDTKTDMKMEGIRLTLANLSAAQAQADRDFVQQIKDNLGLLSLPLKSIVAQDGDEAIRNYAYGCVLRRDGDSFVLPEDTDALPLLEPQEYEGTMPYTPDECQPFRDQEGAFWSRLPETEATKDIEETEGTEGTEESDYVLCAYRRLTGDYYYLYYMPLASVEGFFQTRFDTESVMTGAETVYDGYFATWIEDNGEYSLFYESSIFEGRGQPEDLGVSIGKGKSGFRPTTIDDVRYMYAVSAPLRVASLPSGVWPPNA